MLLTGIPGAPLLRARTKHQARSYSSNTLPGRERARPDQSQRNGAVQRRPHRLALADRLGDDQEPVKVHQSGAGQLREQVRPGAEHDVRAVTRLELAHRVHHIALDELRVGPQLGLPA